MSSYDITKTKCPVCGKLNLRIGDYGIRDIKEEFRVICDSCDFCSETQSGDYGEVFWDFMNHEYEKVAAKHGNKEPEIIAWSKQQSGNVKISYSDGDVLFVKESVFIGHYYDIVDLPKDEAKQRYSNFKIYNKLVRDKIPEIIESKGGYCRTEILDEQAYLEELQKKLDEEVAEYRQDDTIEELADIVEVVYALVKAHGITFSHFESVRKKKKEERGGFEKRIFLKETCNDDT